MQTLVLAYNSNGTDQTFQRAPVGGVCRFWQSLRPKDTAGVLWRVWRAVSLYIRLQSSFWNHRKTLRLRAVIGDAAFWVPQRLWSYAADNQPDGDFSDYSAEEIAMLIGYLGNAKAMLEAMQQASFLDGMRIHGWSEHNAYHSTFSERAKKAAETRWEREREKKRIRKERKGKEPSIATSMLGATVTPADIYEAYPRKVARPEAIKAIERAMSIRSPVELLKLTTDFAATQTKGDPYTPHPSTWFNQQRFNDDPSTWVRRNGKHEPIEPERVKCRDGYGRLKENCHFVNGAWEPKS